MKTAAELEAEIAQKRAAIDALGRPDFWAGTRCGVCDMDTPLGQWKHANPALEAQYIKWSNEVDVLERELADATRREKASRMAAKALQSAKDSSGLGGRTLDVAAAPEPNAAVEAVRDWLSGNQSWLVLAGGPGTGKTVAAGVAVLDAARRGERAIVVDATELARVQAFGEGAGRLDELQRARLLVLDDVGVAPLGDYARGVLHSVANYRHDRYLRTIITTNLRGSELRAAIGDRLVDRIAGDGRFVWLSGASMRRQEK